MVVDPSSDFFKAMRGSGAAAARRRASEQSSGRVMGCRG
jgi:hypothetical protein